MKHQFKQIMALKTVTFQELLREKILWSAFVFALLCVSLSYAVSRLSFAENARIALDFGLASLSIVGGLISIVMGASLIAKEVENRTVYLVLTKALGRWQFVLGRLLGLLSVLILNSFLMTLVLMVVYLLSGGQLSFLIVKSLILQCIEFAVLASVACVFSSFSTSTFAAIIASAVWVIGHAMEDLRILSSKIDPPAMRPFLSAVTQVLPDLTRFDIKVQVSHQFPVTWAYTLLSAGYGLAYVLFALVVACLIFSKRDL